MSVASNSNPRSLRIHSDAQASSDNSATKLNDCVPAVRAAYEAAMSNWRQQDAQARRLGLPRPPEPQLADFLVSANGHDRTQGAPRQEPANDNAAAAIPLGGDELPRRAIPEDLSIPEFLKRTPAPANDNPSASMTPVDGLPERLVAPVPATKPTAIAPVFANIPAELTALPHWFMWRYILKPGKQKPDKVPFQTNGKFAKTNDSSTWNTFDACCAAYNRSGFDGIGFVFDGEVADDGLCYVGADFDRCIADGKLVKPARSRIARLQTYTELSVSGTGVHCILRAKPGTTFKDIHDETGRSVELYSKAGISHLQGFRSAKAAAKLKPPPQKWMRLSRKRERSARRIPPPQRLQSPRTYPPADHRQFSANLARNLRA
jgi:hypothetical protein